MNDKTNTIHQIGNVLKILENCNLLSIDDANRNEIKNIQEECKKMLKRYDGDIPDLEWLKDYFDENTYQQVEEVLKDSTETTFDLEYGQADGIWFNCIYIKANYEKPKTIIVCDDYHKYKPVQRILKDETNFEIVLDPMRAITCVEDHGGIGSYFDNLKPNDHDWINDIVDKIVKDAKEDNETRREHVNTYLLEHIGDAWEKILDEAMKQIEEANTVKEREINDTIDQFFNEMSEKYNIEFDSVPINDLWRYNNEKI
jgi:hypothetical protein